MGEIHISKTLSSIRLETSFSVMGHVVGELDGTLAMELSERNWPRRFQRSIRMKWPCGLDGAWKIELGGANLHNHVNYSRSAEKPERRNPESRGVSWVMTFSCVEILGKGNATIGKHVNPIPACHWNHWLWDSGLVKRLCSLLFFILPGVVSCLHNGRASPDISGFLSLKSHCNITETDGTLESSEEEHKLWLLWRQNDTAEAWGLVLQSLSTFQDSMSLAIKSLLIWEIQDTSFMVSSINPNKMLQWLVCWVWLPWDSRAKVTGLTGQLLSGQTKGRTEVRKGDTVWGGHRFREQMLWLEVEMARKKWNKFS